MQVALRRLSATAALSAASTSSAATGVAARRMAQCGSSALAKQMHTLASSSCADSSDGVAAAASFAGASQLITCAPGGVIGASRRRMATRAAAASAPVAAAASAAQTTSGSGVKKPLRSQPKWDLARMLVPGSVHNGFKVESAVPHPALNMVIYTLRHVASQATYVHIDRDDTDNAFCVGFRTLPRDDSGIAHILEHTALCGSEKYPVRDPFFLLLRRSLNTFMNAMTRPECTFYPFSSTNEKDFSNLLSVYLDAVFFPLLQEADFRQEGHRLEVVWNAPAPAGPTSSLSEVEAEAESVPEPGSPASPTSSSTSSSSSEGQRVMELVYKGVVFNEMKGALSEPAQQFYGDMEKQLYPTSVYRNNSGGDPLAIPSLTVDGLRAFHTLHYHPSNAIFFTYGDMNPRLAEVDEACSRKLARLAAADPAAIARAYEIEPPVAALPAQDSARLRIHGAGGYPSAHSAPSSAPSASTEGKGAPSYPAVSAFNRLLEERCRFSRPRIVHGTGPGRFNLQESEKE